MGRAERTSEPCKHSIIIVVRENTGLSSVSRLVGSAPLVLRVALKIMMARASMSRLPSRFLSLFSAFSPWLHLFHEPFRSLRDFSSLRHWPTFLGTSSFLWLEKRQKEGDLLLLDCLSRREFSSDLVASNRFERCSNSSQFPRYLAALVAPKRAVIADRKRISMGGYFYLKYIVVLW